MSKRQKPDRAGMVSGIAAATGRTHPLVPQSAMLGSRPKSREGKVALTSWHEPAVVKQLKQLSADTGIKQQRLVAQALNLLFREYRRPEIAEG
jgi:hypothetical protein